MEQVEPSIIAASLKAAIIKNGMYNVCRDLHISRLNLLEMLELKRDFNRRVLRYLGFRRKVVYYRATN